MLAAWLLCLLTLSSCGSAYYLKRAQKNLEKAQEKGATWSRDTVYMPVEIVRPETRVDTLVKWAEAIRDTIRVTKDRTVTKVLIKPGEPVYVSTYVPADTVVKEIPTYITNTIEAKKSRPTWWDFIVGLLIAIVLTYIIARLTGRR